MAQLSSTDWQALVFEQRSWLRSIIGRQLSEPAAVEDVLQETLVAGIEKETDQDGVGDLKAWLGGIARHKSQDHLRKKLRQSRNHQRFGAEAEHPETHPTPLEILLDAERGSIVRRALAQLEECDAELLRMKYAHGMSYAEIGTASGLNRNGVANALRAAQFSFSTSSVSVSSCFLVRSAAVQPPASPSPELFFRSALTAAAHV